MIENLRVSQELYGYDYPNLAYIDLKANYPKNWQEEDFKKYEIRVARIPLHAVGFGAFTHTDKSMQIIRVAVATDYLDQGVFERIFKYLEDEAKDMGLTKISIIVPESTLEVCNLRFCELLRGLGYRSNVMSRGIYFKKAL